MQRTATDPNHFAQDLFAPLPRRYDILEHLLSLGQNERWRREMISHVGTRDPQTVLDVATGTAGVALALTRTTNARITGIDITEPMLREGRERVERAGGAGRVQLVAGGAERLPFPDASFDGLTFTYLLRYLVDPGVNGRLDHRDDGTDVVKYDAPKAKLMALITDGILNQKLPWSLVLIGALMAVSLELCMVPSLPFAVGIYLPLQTSFPIFVGGVMRWMMTLAWVGTVSSQVGELIELACSSEPPRLVSGVRR